MTKRIAVPICYAIYSMSNKDALTVINGSTQVQPPAILLETMVFDGKAKRETVIHTHEFADDPEDEIGHDHEGLWPTDEDEDE